MQPIATDLRPAVRTARPGLKSIAPGLKSIAPGLKSVAIVLCLAGAAIAFTATAATAEVKGGKEGAGLVGGSDQPYGSGGVTPGQAARIGQLLDVRPEKKKDKPAGKGAKIAGSGATKGAAKGAGKGAGKTDTAALNGPGKPNIPMELRSDRGKGPKGPKPGGGKPNGKGPGGEPPDSILDDMGQDFASVYRDYEQNADNAFNSALDAKRRCEMEEFEYHLGRLEEMAKDFEETIEIMEGQVEDRMKWINEEWPGGKGFGDDLKKAKTGAERDAAGRKARQDVDKSAKDGKTSRKARDKVREHLDKLKELNDALKKARDALDGLEGAIDLLKLTSHGCAYDHASYDPGPGNDKDMLAAVLAAQQGLSAGGQQGFVIIPFGRRGPPSALDAANGAIHDRFGNLATLSAIENAGRQDHGGMQGGGHEYGNQDYEAGYAAPYAAEQTLQSGQPAAAETAVEPGAETRVEAATAQPTPRGPVTLGIPAGQSAPGGMTRVEVPRTTVTATPRGAEPLSNR